VTDATTTTPYFDRLTLRLGRVLADLAPAAAKLLAAATTEKFMHLLDEQSMTQKKPSQSL